MRFLVVQDYKENRRKCTLTPLVTRDDVSFVRLRRPTGRDADEEVEVEGGLLLDVDAPPLARVDREALSRGSHPESAVPIVIVDSTWVRVRKVMQRLRSIPGTRMERRSLPADVITAYPRVSKLYEDPRGGLASVEAMYTATVILGSPCLDLLREYRWADAFLGRNRHVFQRFGA